MVQFTNLAFEQDFPVKVPEVFHPGMTPQSASFYLPSYFRKMYFNIILIFHHIKLCHMSVFDKRFHLDLGLNVLFSHMRAMWLAHRNVFTSPMSY